MKSLVFVVALMLATGLPTTAESTDLTPATGPDPAAAATYFAEARALADRDAGRLWGVRLDGPMLFVDPTTRLAVANRADAVGKLASSRGVFAGQLGAEVAVANTAVTWSGVHWTMILWPLPTDPTRRAELMAHEMFHRIQLSLGLPMSNPANAHLDSLDGRYLLQLEWRALRVALDSTGRRRANAVSDALTFRQLRRSLFPAAGKEEVELECNEGLAEYTGCVIANSTVMERRAAAIRRLEAAPSRPSLTRSFAYASGPAYGVLLDEADTTWRTRVAETRDLGALLGPALRLRGRPMTRPAIDRRAQLYGGNELLASERVRDTARRERIAADRARFVDGAVLVLPLRSPNLSFDPNALSPLEPFGTVYATASLSDAWGTLEVSRGALLSSDWSSVTVALAPGRDLASLAGPTVTGDGWHLELAPGWSIVAAGKPGSFIVVTGTPPAPNPASQ